MKSVSIRELHARTGRIVREAARHGQILVTDNGHAVARLMPESATVRAPYFARRKFISPGIKKRIQAGRLGAGGRDSTGLISEDREDRA